MVGSRAGDDASRNDTDDMPRMKVFRDRSVPGDHRENGVPKCPVCVAKRVPICEAKQIPKDQAAPGAE